MFCVLDEGLNYGGIPSEATRLAKYNTYICTDVPADSCNMLCKFTAYFAIFTSQSPKENEKATTEIDQRISNQGKKQTFTDNMQQQNNNRKKEDNIYGFY